MDVEYIGYVKVLIKEFGKCRHDDFIIAVKRDEPIRADQFIRLISV